MNWIEFIKNYEPSCAQEISDKEIMIKFIDEFDDVLTRNNKVAHMTSSAFVVNKKTIAVNYFSQSVGDSCANVSIACS